MQSEQYDTKDTDEGLEYFVKSEKLAYARASQSRFKEEGQVGFYICLVFQNNECASEFISKNEKIFKASSFDQIFFDGHEVAENLGTPLATKYFERPVSLDKFTNDKLIKNTGILK